MRRTSCEHSARHRRRTGFSLVELLVVVAIVVILFSIFVPYVWKVREADRRAACANNLRALHAALTKYADENGHDYPRTAFDVGAARYVAYTGAAAVVSPPPATAPGAKAGAGSPAAPAGGAAETRPATGPVATRPASGPANVATTGPGPRPGPGAVQLNDVTASLWLLARPGQIDPKQFVCPSGDETPDPLLTNGRRVRPDQRSNFTSGRHLSYSYAYPFLDVAGKPQLNTDRLPPDFAILADKNPGTSPATGDDAAGPAYDAPGLSLAPANSRNHGRAGQNVLYVTGEVRFQKTPYCGYGVPPYDPKTPYRDNVYTGYPRTPAPGTAVPKDPQANGSCSSTVVPGWAYDSYLVPTAGE
jgi:prepilin-type N-terminal cleavage/methylation domain-containing protein